MSVHVSVVQLLPSLALSQRVEFATHPGANTGVPATTALVAKAVLFPVLESPGFDIAILKVTDDPAAAG